MLELEQVKKMQLELNTDTRVDENKHQSSNHRQEVNSTIGKKDRKQTQESF
jgi:hypothetical protein